MMGLCGSYLDSDVNRCRNGAGNLTKFQIALNINASKYWTTQLQNTIPGLRRIRYTKFNRINNLYQKYTYNSQNSIDSHSTVILPACFFQNY